MGSTDTIKPVILFDGVCNLCNHSVQFVINHDRRAEFSFAALQSDFGQAQLQKHDFDTTRINTIVLIAGDKAYDRSRAALEIARRLDGAWPLMYAFVIVPPFIRNFVYDWISRNRYRWFGKTNECWIPTPDLKARFVG